MFHKRCAQLRQIFLQKEETVNRLRNLQNSFRQYQEKEDKCVLCEDMTKRSGLISLSDPKSLTPGKQMIFFYKVCDRCSHFKDVKDRVSDHFSKAMSLS